MRRLITGILNRLPYVRGLYRHYTEFRRNACYAPGHYYSPIVSVEDLKNREADIWKTDTAASLPGIDLNVEFQKELIGSLQELYPEMPHKSYKQDGLRYHFDNDMYSYTDGIILYTLMRHLRPHKIIEVGSGYSSALMLDVNEAHFDNEISLHFIEPYPERLYNNISDSDKKRVTVLAKKVQEVPSSYFETLGKGDILFIDSTHVAKTGSDVNYIFFDILPVLKPGVWIHFHDIFYPFEYPKNWVYGGRNWNENYMLRSFLMYNNDYQIRLFPHYLHQHHKELFEQMPLAYKNRGGNIWIEKIK